LRPGQRVPRVANWPRTVIAVNSGGAVMPTIMSLYLLIKRMGLASLYHPRHPI
jgi:uncharacterized membrane protein